MSKYSDEVLGPQIDADGNRRLFGGLFSGERFEELAFGPLQSPAQQYLIERCTFINCVIESRLFHVFDGVQLRDVTFHNVSSLDPLTISTYALLENVKVSGCPKSGGVWVKPFESAKGGVDQYRVRAMEYAQNVQCMLNIEECADADVEILGLPVDKVVFNRDCHCVINRKWSTSVDWKGIGIPATSFWRTRLLRLNVFNVDSGVFSLPQKGERLHEKTMEEMRVLERAGVICEGGGS